MIFPFHHEPNVNVCQSLMKRILLGIHIIITDVLPTHPVPGHRNCYSPCFKFVIGSLLLDHPSQGFHQKSSIGPYHVLIRNAQILIFKKIFFSSSEIEPQIAASMQAHLISKMKEYN